MKKKKKLTARQRKLAAMYGEDFVRQMHQDKRKLKKLYKKDYEDMLQHFNELIKYHEERLS